jgi:hypothetical protein
MVPQDRRHGDILETPLACPKWHTYPTLVPANLYRHSASDAAERDPSFYRNTGTLTTRCARPQDRRTK